MSEYTDLEESVSDSVPLELYEFIGSFRSYFYTSTNTVQIFGGKSFAPIPVTRSRVKAGTSEDEGLALDLEIPFDVDVVMDYAFAQTPPTLMVKVYRKQRDGSAAAYSLFWQGIVRGFSVSDLTARIQIPSIFSLALKGDVPNVYYQGPCNHVLYNARCTIDRAAHRFLSTVTGPDGAIINLSTSPTTTGDLAGGEVINMRTGERRLILSNDASQIFIGYKFVDIKPGDPVELYRGCDHSLPTCKVKFNNVINFGGFPHIPADNPFEGTL